MTSCKIHGVLCHAPPHTAREPVSLHRAAPVAGREEFSERNPSMLHSVPRRPSVASQPARPRSIHRGRNAHSKRSHGRSADLSRCGLPWQPSDANDEEPPPVALASGGEGGVTVVRRGAAVRSCSMTIDHSRSRAPFPAKGSSASARVSIPAAARHNLRGRRHPPRQDRRSRLRRSRRRHSCKRIRACIRHTIHHTRRHRTACSGSAECSNFRLQHTRPSHSRRPSMSAACTSRNSAFLQACTRSSSDTSLGSHREQNRHRCRRPRYP